MPIARSWSLMGGYTCASQPVTWWPSSRAILASPPMKVPQMPRMCRCMRRSALEDEVDGAQEAQARPQVVPTEPLAHVEERERREDRECYHFLQDLQLCERCPAREADAVGRDHDQVLEERDAP